MRRWGKNLSMRWWYRTVCISLISRILHHDRHRSDTVLQLIETILYLWNSFCEYFETLATPSQTNHARTDRPDRPPLGGPSRPAHVVGC